MMTNETKKERKERLARTYQGWIDKYRDPEARPEAFSTDLEVEIYLEMSRSREFGIPEPTLESLGFVEYEGD